MSSSGFWFKKKQQKTFRQQLIDADAVAVENLLNDVTTGNLRKRMARNAAAKGFDLSDTDDEAEILRALKRRQAAMVLRDDYDDDEDRPILERLGVLSLFP